MKLYKVGRYVSTLAIGLLTIVIAIFIGIGMAKFAQWLTPILF